MVTVRSNCGHCPNIRSIPGRPPGRKCWMEGTGGEDGSVRRTTLKIPVRTGRSGTFVHTSRCDTASPLAGRAGVLVAQHVLKPAVSALAVEVAELGVVLAGDGLAAPCAWLPWLERVEQLAP